MFDKNPMSIMFVDVLKELDKNYEPTSPRWVAWMRQAVGQRVRMITDRQPSDCFEPCGEVELSRAVQ